MSSPNIPPVQQKYFAKRREPVPYVANTTLPSGVNGANLDGAHSAQPAYTIPAHPHHVAEKTAIRGMGYFQFMTGLQTLFQLGILVCMIAMVAKLYQAPSVSSSSSRF